MYFCHPVILALPPVSILFRWIEVKLIYNIKTKYVMFIQKHFRPGKRACRSPPRAWRCGRGRAAGRTPQSHPCLRWPIQKKIKINKHKIKYKSYRTHGTIENKIESFSSRYSIFYDSMSTCSDFDLYSAPSFMKLKVEPFISVSLRLLQFAYGVWYNILLL